MPYLATKALHVIAVVLFLGNITTGIFWKRHADRTRDPRIIAHMLEGLTGSDRWFTMPGVFLIILFGVGAAMMGGLPMLRTGWILWAIVLFILSGFAFMAQVSPLQKRMAKLMRAGLERGTPDWAAYERMSHAWDAWGAIALLTPVAALFLMVLKPHLPGL